MEQSQRRSSLRSSLYRHCERSEAISAGGSICYEVHQGLLEIHDNQTEAEGVDFRPRFE